MIKDAPCFRLPLDCNGKKEYYIWEFSSNTYTGYSHISLLILGAGYKLPVFKNHYLETKEVEAW